MNITNNLLNAKEQELPNGLKFVTVKKNTQLASIHLGIRLGAMDENFDEKGICHFIEHMLFKGTTKRANHEINQALEERGGYYNAYTDYGATVYSITALSEELEASIDVLSDIIINSTFPYEEIKKEKKVIQAEIKAHRDDVEEYSFRKAHETAFQIGPLKYDVIGNENMVKSFTKQQMETFYRNRYIPNHCVISIVSPYEHKDMGDLILRYFGEWKKGQGINRKTAAEKNNCLEKTSYKKNIEQTTLLYLYTFYDLSRKEELALEILNHKLGVSANSILFRALREEKGLSYDIYSEMDASESIKTLYIYTAVSHDEVAEAKRMIEECIQGIIERKIIISEKDIKLMKKVIKTGVASMLEDSAGLCNYILHQKLEGKKIDTYEEDMRILDQISLDDIYNAANKVFDKPTIHILMNKKID